MPTILKCEKCNMRYYTANSMEKGEVSGDCEECSGKVIALGSPGQVDEEDELN